MGSFTFENHGDVIQEVLKVGAALGPRRHCMSQPWGSWGDPGVWDPVPDAPSCLACEGWSFVNKAFSSGLPLAWPGAVGPSGPFSSVPLPSRLVVTREVAAPTQQVAARAESLPWEPCPGEAGSGGPQRRGESKGMGLSCSEGPPRW